MSLQQPRASQRLPAHLLLSQENKMTANSISIWDYELLQKCSFRSAVLFFKPSEVKAGVPLVSVLMLS